MISYPLPYKAKAEVKRYKLGSLRSLIWILRGSFICCSELSITLLLSKNHSPKFWKVLQMLSLTTA